MSKRKRTTRNSKRAAMKPTGQLFMCVVDHGATSSSNAQNHFGFSPFSLTVTVEPLSLCDDLAPQPLSMQLMFADGHQIDTVSNGNGIKWRTSPPSLTIDSDGKCQFTAHIDTYSMFHDNRAFKLVFNLGEGATRHIRPCETKPFRLVKHRLEIVEEPDNTFFKDEGGRANCLHCKILLKDCQNVVVENRDIPLTAKLVYEDMSLAQSSRDILEVLTQNVQLKKGQSEVDFRINEVSKNHNKRAFRVLFECKSQDALYHDISSCVTTRIMVKSKRTKKKGPRSRIKTKGRKRKRTKQESDDSGSDGEPFIDMPMNKKRRASQRRDYNGPFGVKMEDHTQFVPPAITGILPSMPHTVPFHGLEARKNGPPELGNGNAGGGGGVLGHMFGWCQLAGWVMTQMEWTHCGFEYDEATQAVDSSRPLYRCSYCLKYRNTAGWGQHEEWCQLKRALTEYEQRIQRMHSEWNYQLHSKEQGAMPMDQSSPHDDRPSMPSNNGPFAFSNMPFAQNMPPFPPMNNVQNIGGDAVKTEFVIQNNQASNPPSVPPSKAVQAQNPVNGQNGKSEQNGDGLETIDLPPALPITMPKIASVSKVPSLFGFDAFDDNEQFLGSFDGSGGFMNAGQLSATDYQPTFDASNMLSRNQSDDNAFYSSIRNSLFDRQSSK